MRPGQPHTEVCGCLFAENWINKDLISAKLSKDEFEDIVPEVSFLVDEILKNLENAKYVVNLDI